MCARTIITKGDLRTQNPLKNKIIQDMVGKTGKTIFRTVADQRAFLKEIQKFSNDKAKRTGGIRGLNHHDLKDFFGKMMQEKGDRFNDLKIKKAAKIFIHHGKTYSENPVSHDDSHGSYSPQHVTAPTGLQEKKPEINMRELTNKIRKNDRTIRTDVVVLQNGRNSEGVDDPRNNNAAREPARSLSFALSNKNIKDGYDKGVFSQSAGIHSAYIKRPDHLYGNHKHNNDKPDEDVKSMLEKIQSNSENEDLKKAA